MSEFCNSACTEFCTELAVVCKINKVAQKW